MQATSVQLWSVRPTNTPSRQNNLNFATDGHMDIDAVRPGAIVIAPVKVPGAGIYFGDMHAMQGDGEIAGHTMDVPER